MTPSRSEADDDPQPLAADAKVSGSFQARYDRPCRRRKLETTRDLNAP